jgi:hypothetical protein
VNNQFSLYSASPPKAFAFRLVAVVALGFLGTALERSGVPSSAVALCLTLAASFFACIGIRSLIGPGDRRKTTQPSAMPKNQDPPANKGRAAGA